MTSHFRELAVTGELTEDQVGWLAKLQTLFETHIKDGSLWRIAHANSCRELWLHGQLYLAGFRIGEPAIWKGLKPGNKKKSQEKADFSAPNTDPIVVGEVKFFWTRNFQEKGIDVPKCLSKTRAKQQLSVKDLPEGWGALVDYVRLRKASLELVEPGILRLFVLVLARVALDERDDLGILLEEMELEGTTPIVGFPKTENLWIRAWKVDPI